jgi:hypothetical protein
MICIAFEAPPDCPCGPVVLVLVLEKDNLDRMKLADPLDIQLKDIPQVAHRGVRELDVVVAYEEDLSTLLKFHERGDLNGLMNWIERGRVIKPGDLVPPMKVHRA